MAEEHSIVTGVVIDSAEFSLAELCEACGAGSDWLMELVDEGVLEPIGSAPDNWRFVGVSLYRARTVRRLQRDLGVNLAGAALVLELLTEVEALRRQLAARGGRG